MDMFQHKNMNISIPALMLASYTRKKLKEKSPNVVTLLTLNKLTYFK